MSEYSIEALWDVFYFRNKNRLVFANVVKCLNIFHIEEKLFNYQT